MPPKSINSSQQSTTASIFAQFVDMLPYTPYCTNNLNWGVYTRRKETAIKKSYIQLNTKNRFIALAFDLDHKDSALRFESANLPEPTFTVINPVNGHAHYIYLLNNPIWATSQKKEMGVMRAIRDAYTLKLDADINYNGFLVKNPLSTTHNYYMWWRTSHTNKTYTLDELAEYIDDIGNYNYKKALCIRRKSSRNNTTNAIKGRNCMLFEIGRFFAYDTVCLCENEAELLERSLSYITERNTGGLPNSELRSIARSISKYTWTNRERFTRRPAKQKRTLDLCQNSSLSERQKAGALYTNQIKRENTENKLKSAIIWLLAQGKRPTKAEIARISGVSRDTVYRYLHLLEEYTKVSDTVSLSGIQPPSCPQDELEFGEIVLPEHQGPKVQSPPTVRIRKCGPVPPMRIQERPLGHQALPQGHPYPETRLAVSRSPPEDIWH